MVGYCCILKTSAQSNLSKCRIAVLSPLAAANAFVFGVRWAGTFTRCGKRTVLNTLMRRYVTMGWHWHIYPSKVALSMGDRHRLPSKIRGLLVQHDSAPKRHLDRFSRFCTARLCVEHTQKNVTHTQTALRATSVAIGVQALRPKYASVISIRFNRKSCKVIWVSQKALIHIKYGLIEKIAHCRHAHPWTDCRYGLCDGIVD